MKLGIASCGGGGGGKLSLLSLLKNTATDSSSRASSFICTNNSTSSNACSNLTSRMRMDPLDCNNNDKKKKKYEEYNHTDHPICRFRWTCRESFEYMYDKRGMSWHKINDFYSSLISNHHQPIAHLIQQNTPSALSLLASFYHQHAIAIGESDKCDDGNLNNASNGVLNKHSSGGGGWERRSFKIVVSYHGESFDGWQKQADDLNTVQAVLENVLGRFVDDRKAQQLRDKSLPLEACVSVAGRTDKGVTALHQVCSFYTWRKDVICKDIMDAINNAAPGKLRAVFVSEVSRTFHPNFAAKWRRYLYIFPVDNEKYQGGDGIVTSSDENEKPKFLVDFDDNKDINSEMKPTNFEVCKLNELLRQLEGKSLSYSMFARDTKASRSSGPPTECFMFHSRATEAMLPCTNQDGIDTRVMCVELVANRFLRKMVRVLVATAIREAAAGVGADGLIKLMDASCRRATAPPAPPDGLCLVDVGYSDFDPKVKQTRHFSHIGVATSQMVIIYKLRINLESANYWVGK